MGQNRGTLVNIKIVGKWVFIPLTLIIGFHPWPYPNMEFEPLELGIGSANIGFGHANTSVNRSPAGLFPAVEQSMTYFPRIYITTSPCAGLFCTYVLLVKLYLLLHSHIWNFGVESNGSGGETT